MFNYKRWNQNLKIAFLALIIALFIWAEKSKSSPMDQEIVLPNINIEEACSSVVDNQLSYKPSCENKLLK